jgi:hypothetical protein
VVRRLVLGLPEVIPTLLAQKSEKVKPLRLSGGQDLPILAVFFLLGFDGYWRVLTGFWGRGGQYTCLGLARREPDTSCTEKRKSNLCASQAVRIYEFWPF